jgi:Tol biopolymer transport system component
MSWSPDGASIHYTVLRDGNGNIWSQPLAGTAAQQLTAFDTGEVFSFAWSRDGQRLAVARGTVNTDVVLITDQAKPW